MRFSVSIFLFVRFLSANLVVASWVDPDTPTVFRTTESLYDGDERNYELVFSDEFEQDGRNFQDGNDPRWTSLHKNDCECHACAKLVMEKYLTGQKLWSSSFFLFFSLCSSLFFVVQDTNAALHYYHSDNAETKDGLLKIKTEKKDNAYRAFDEKLKKFYNDKKHIQSAMLQGWNKFCFTGGIVEFSAKLPGSPRIGGLWPARKLHQFGGYDMMVVDCVLIMCRLFLPLM